ncbi:MAG: heavy-metal-associated domain-containing protein [Dehalococcoidia bacterium]
MATIRLAVGQVDGVTSVEGDAKKQTIAVEYEPLTVTAEAIRATLEETGWDSSVVE